MSTPSAGALSAGQIIAAIVGNGTSFANAVAVIIDRETASPIGYALASAVLEWWNQHQFDSQPCGDGDYCNTYDDAPEFVEIAKQFIIKWEGRA